MTDAQDIKRKYRLSEEDARDLRVQIFDWMVTVLDETGWTYEEWARRAGIAGTTLTRGLTDFDRMGMSLPTVHKLVKASGIPFQIMPPKL